MQARRKHLAVLATICASVLFFSGGSAHADETFIGKYQGAKQGNLDNKPHVIVTLIGAVGNKQMQFGIPNADEKATPPKLAPLPDLLASVRSFKPGDVLKVTYTSGGMPPVSMMSAIIEYPMKPGEDEPNGFIFSQSYEHKEGKVSYTWVDLKKFNEVVIVMVPNHKDKTGEPEPDPEILGVVNNLKEGDAVLVDASPAQPKPMIRHIEAYTPAKSGKVLKVDDKVDLDGTPDTTVDIDVDGTTVTAFVPLKPEGKKFVVDSKLLAAVKKFHKDSEVTFRTSEENGHVFIRSIVMTKGSHAAPASKPAAMEKDKPTK